jgi:inward rectifier potassium channel
MDAHRRPRAAERLSHYLRARKERGRVPTRSYEIRVVGAPFRPFRDGYHTFLGLSWGAAIGVIAGVYLASNALFAVLYALVGGVQGLPNHSFSQAFFFSVQTMGTIGYGSMVPSSTAAHLVVVAESVYSLVLVALCTGMIFAKFSQVKGRLIFAPQTVVTLWDGVPTLSVRLGNDRGNRIVEARVHVDLMRTRKTAEGVTFYELTALVPVRDRIAALSRSWNLLHRIDASSPLFGATPDSLLADEAEILVSVMGTDETTGQTVHGQHSFEAPAIVYGARFRDVLTEIEGGDLVFNAGNFSLIEATPPSELFPYTADV